MALPIYLFLAAATVVVAVVNFRNSNGTRIQKAIAGLIPISAAGAALGLWVIVVQGSTRDWNEAKLAPVVAMTRGYSLYQDPFTGVMTGWLYGPIGAIILLPSALAHDPTTAVFIGNLISMACSLLPAWWMLSVAGRDTARQLKVLAFLVFIWQAVLGEELYRSMLMVTPDAPAAGLAICACAVIYSNRSTRRLGISAAAAILCVWTKQNYISLPLALLLWVAVIDGRKKAGLFLVLLIGVGAVISAALLFSFGPSNMFFHMITLPAHHAWRETASHGPTGALLLGIRDMVFNAAPYLGLLGAAMLFEAFAVRSATRTMREWLGERPWMMLVVVSFFLIPGSLAAYLKLGGFINNLGSVNCFLLLAAMAAILDVCGSVKLQQPRAVQVAACGMMLFGLMKGVGYFSQTSGNGVFDSMALLAHPWQNPQQALFKYASQHRGELYCPWNPLTTLFADEKLYHFEWGIYDHIYAGFKPSLEQYSTHISPKTARVIYLHQPQSILALSVLVDFRLKIEVPELPGCVVFVPNPHEP